MWPFVKKQTGKVPSEPFPWRQMLVLCLCRLCEPIAFMSIFPYVYFMIESFRITSNEQEITFYAGTVTAAFAFAEFLAAMSWGVLSDKVGRKPVLLCGIAGTGVSMIMFGFATNLPMAIVARALGGLLNGNIGVINATVNDIVKNEAHRRQGFTMIPFTWCIGTIIGAAIGGALADPVKAYGWSQHSIFASYPFLLPNIICTAVVIFGFIFGILFFEESAEGMTGRRDYGVEAGRWLISLFTCKRKVTNCKLLEIEEEQLLVEHDEECLPDYDSAAAAPRLSASAPDGIPPPAYQSKEGTPRSSICDHAPILLSHDLEAATNDSRPEWRKVFNNQILLQVLSYGVLAYHTITAEQLLPVMFTQPESDAPVHLPFFFSGGFGWEVKTAGSVLACQGIIQMVISLAVYPWVAKKINALTLLRIIAWTYPLLYIAIPYLVLLPHMLRTPCVYIVLVWKVASQTMALPSHQMIISSIVKEKMGSVQGATSSSASLSRAIGPLVAGTLQTAGLARGTIALPWYVTAAVTCSGGIICSFMTYNPQGKQTKAVTKHNDSGTLAAPEHLPLLEQTPPRS